MLADGAMFQVNADKIKTGTGENFRWARMAERSPAGKHRFPFAQFCFQRLAFGAAGVAGLVSSASRTGEYGQACADGGDAEVAVGGVSSGGQGQEV